MDIQEIKNKIKDIGIETIDFGNDALDAMFGFTIILKNKEEIHVGCDSCYDVPNITFNQYNKINTIKNGRR